MWQKYSKKKCIDKPISLLLLSVSKYLKLCKYKWTCLYIFHKKELKNRMSQLNHKECIEVIFFANLTPWKSLMIRKLNFTYRFSYSFFNLFKISNFLNVSLYLFNRKMAKIQIYQKQTSDFFRSNESFMYLRYTYFSLQILDCLDMEKSVTNPRTFRCIFLRND